MYYNGKLKKYANSMRREMTKEERKLWFEFLRELPIRFYRQKIIGNYIADFYCASKRMIIELDGSQHFDSTVEYDKRRDEYFSNIGITVVRYPNNAVTQNFDGVCTDILSRIGLCDDDK